MTSRVVAAVALALVSGCTSGSGSEPVATSVAPPSNTEPGADLSTASVATAELAVYPISLRQGDTLTFWTSECAADVEGPLSLWLRRDGERFGDPIPISRLDESTIDGNAGDYWVRIPVPEWQEPGVYSAEMPCPGGPVFMGAWQVLPPWPTSEMWITPDVVEPSGEFTITVDCKVPMGNDQAVVYVGSDRDRLVREVMPTASGSHRYETTFALPYWWGPADYPVVAFCPGGRPDDVMPGDPAPVDLDPGPGVVHVEAAGDLPWDLWRPIDGPVLRDTPDLTWSRGRWQWYKVPPEGGVAKLSATCDPRIEIGDGARFVGYWAPWTPGEDWDDDALQVIEWPARSFEERGDGVAIIADIALTPAFFDELAVGPESIALTIVAMCAATVPSFEPAIHDEHDEASDGHLFVWMPPPAPTASVSRATVKVGETLTIEIDCVDPAFDMASAAVSTRAYPYGEIVRFELAEPGGDRFVTELPVDFPPGEYDAWGSCLDNDPPHIRDRYTDEQLPIAGTRVDSEFVAHFVVTDGS